MDITEFVQSLRDQAFLVGDHGTYRSQLSRQLHNLRKKLGRATPKNAKFTKRDTVTIEDVAKNPEFVRLLLLQSERAWAHAMHMKSAHAEDNASKGITGSTRRHIISRLHKASGYADQVVGLLRDKDTTGAKDMDFLEAQAYALQIAGAEQLERQSSQRHENPKAAWSSCLTLYSEAHVIYTALLYSTQKETFREVISSNIDPSIRYAAYQSQISRTIAIPTIAKQHFRRDQKQLLDDVTKLYPAALSEEKTTKATNKEGLTTDIPTTITWRGRTAPIADAAIGQAQAATTLAVTKLNTTYREITNPCDPKAQKALAAAYDPVLTAAQDTVDATRRAITDLTKEGVSESDTRMQDLRVTDLFANYQLISWRIGRNRVLISSTTDAGADASLQTLDDGAHFIEASPRAPRTRKTAAATTTTNGDDTAMTDATAAPQAKSESRPHKIARLRTRLVLYDATLQSLDSIRDLRGATRDAGFLAELDAQRAYFHALNCVNVGVGNQAAGKRREALALFVKAQELVDAAAQGGSNATSKVQNDAAGGPPTLAVSGAQLTALQKHVRGLVSRQHGLVALHALTAQQATSTQSQDYKPRPLVERLDEYPASGEVDLTNLVTYPPQLEPVPVKPIFYDFAFNYIEFPGRGGVGDGKGKEEDAMDVDGQETKQQQAEKKKGWFGWRS